MCIIFYYVGNGDKSAKHILFHIFRQIVDYKKSDGGKSSIEAAAADGYGYDDGMQDDDNAAAPAYDYHEGNNALAVVEAVPLANGNKKVLQALDMNAPMKAGRTQLQVSVTFYPYIKTE